MTESQRLDRLESKVDKIQDQIHSNHLELLSAFSRSKDETDAEIVELKLTTQRHSGYFSAVAKLLGLSSVVSGWLALKDYFGVGK